METSDTAKNNRLLTGLLELYAHLPQMAEETFHGLGKEHAAYFSELVNDWIAIQGSIGDSYPKDELTDSLLYICFHGLIKEIYWFHLLLLAGNYPLLQRGLRYAWEMIFRAYYVDTYICESQDDPEPPGLTLDDKVAWLAQHERRMYQWEFMKLRLRQLAPEAKGTVIERDYKLLWDKLNSSVHPSKALLDRMVVQVPGFLMTDTFDKEWALETIGDAGKVFDLIWLASLSRFPKCAEQIAQEGLLLSYPIVTTKLGA